MSKAKHTPIRWAEKAEEYDGQTGHMRLQSIILEEATTQDCDPQPIAYVDSPEDLRLFLAAPELLQTLQDLVSDITGRFDMNSPSMNPGLVWAVESAREAITKATGQSKGGEPCL